MRLLLDPPHSATVDSRSLKGRTPLHIAVRTRRGGAESKRESARGEIVRTLCDYGADSSALDRKGNTALHLASRSNNVSLVSSLIGLGCNVGAVDNNGRNCLHVAGEAALCWLGVACDALIA
jgi:ankyrin repeat protein